MVRHRSLQNGTAGEFSRSNSRLQMGQRIKRKCLNDELGTSVKQFSNTMTRYSSFANIQASHTIPSNYTAMGEPTGSTLDNSQKARRMRVARRQALGPKSFAKGDRPLG